MSDLGSAGGFDGDLFFDELDLVFPESSSFLFLISFSLLSLFESFSFSSVLVSFLLFFFEDLDLSLSFPFSRFRYAWKRRILSSSSRTARQADLEEKLS